MPDDRDRAAAERADARDDRVVVGAGAVAVQLDPLVHEAIRVIQRVRPPVVAGELDCIPDVGLGRAHREAAAQTAERRRKAAVHSGPPFVCASPCGRERRKRSTRATTPGGGASASTSIGTSVPPAHRRRMRPRSSFRSGRFTTASIEAVLVARLGATEIVRQRLARGLLHHARARERQQRVGLGDHEVAERRERRDHAARRRMGEHGDVRHARLAQQVDRADCLRHLHEREHVLLHARAAGGRDRDQRDAALGRHVAGAREQLAHDAAHRAAHEGEVHRAEHARHALDRRGADDHRVAQPGGHLGLAQALGVRAQIGERERIGRAHVEGELAEAPGIGELLHALLGPHREMVSAHRADAQSGAQLVLAIVRLAVRAGVRMQLRAGKRLLGRRLLALHLDLDVFGLLVAGHRHAS